MRSLLVTNDFPPKVGGIQSYLWELWRRLPPEEVGVFTTPWTGAEQWDAEQPFPIVRTRGRMLLPTPSLRRRVRTQASRWGVDLVFLDPAVPAGAIGPRLGLPYVVIVHGAEVTAYSRIPGTGAAIRRVLRRAEGVVAAGTYPAREAIRAARRPLRGLVIPPGVDTGRFHPLDSDERVATRLRHGLDADMPLVLGVSRLVPRKGFDVLIDAVAGLDDGVQLAIAGGGRDLDRLRERAQRRGIAARTRFLGRVSDDELPAVYGCADAFSMPCRDRWGGVEQEGFGIVFLEAAACAVPSVAGRSGGSQEAVLDGGTGFVVDPRDTGAVRERLAELLGDDARRCAMGEAARRRAEEEFDSGRLAQRLRPLAGGDLGVLQFLDL